MLAFCAKVLKDAFPDKNDHPRIEEEVNRLFRSNAFNSSVRKNIDTNRLKKFPQLKNVSDLKKDTDFVKRAEMRIQVPSISNRQSYIRSKNEIRPLFARLTPHGAVTSRSPLVSMLFPSLKDKTKIFQDDLRHKESSRSPKANRDSSNSATGTYIMRNELAKIVEEESKRF